MIKKTIKEATENIKIINSKILKNKKKKIQIKYS